MKAAARAVLSCNVFHNYVQAGSNVSVCELKSVNVTEVRYVKGYELYFPLVTFVSCFSKACLFLIYYQLGKTQSTLSGQEKAKFLCGYAECSVLTQK